MGFFDKIKALFAEPEPQKLQKTQYSISLEEKEGLCRKIIETARQITMKSINQTASRYANQSVYSLAARDIEELNEIYTSLTNTLNHLNDKAKEASRRYDEELSRAAWTGEKPRGMSDHDFDQYQQWGDR